MENGQRKPDLQKERAKFIEKPRGKGNKMPDSYAVFLGWVMTVMAFASGFFTLAGSGFAGALRATFALFGIIFAARDLQTLGSGGAKVAAMICAVLFVLGVMDFLSFAASVAR